MSTIRKSLRKVCEAIDDKKGNEVTILDVSRVSSFSDFFVICHGNNPRQNQAICDEITRRLKKDEQLTPHHVEGYQTADWILMDYLGFVIHIFSSRTRLYYRLEKLWSDGVEVEPKALAS